MTDCRWAFLRPSLVPLRGWLDLVPLSIDSIGVGHYDELVRVRKSQCRDLRALREAIVLLAMVASVDQDGAKRVMTDICDLKITDETEMEDESFWPLRFMFSVAALEHAKWTSNDIATLFAGRNEPPSDNFIASARKIAAVGKERAATLGLLSISIFVNVKTATQWAANVGALLRELLAIRDMHHGWRFPIAESDHSDDLSMIPYEFRFGGLQLDLSNSMLAIDDAKAIGEIMGGDQPLPVCQLDVLPHVDDRAVRDNVHSVLVVGELYQSVLCASRSVEKNPVLGTFKTCFEFDPPTMFGRLASILAEARTISKVELEVNSEGEDQKVWEFIAYAFFTKHASAHSSISSLTLTVNKLDMHDADDFVAVLAAPNPTYHVFGLLGGVNGPHNNTRNRSTPCHQRRMRLMAGTQVTMTPIDSSDYDITWKLQSDVDGVRILDDSWDACTKVLVTGFGVCSVRRDQLLPLDDDYDSSTHPNEITSLHLDITGTVDNSEPLFRILELIGHKLTQLRLDEVEGNTLDIRRLLRCCPNLKVLHIDFSAMLDTSDFLKGIRENKMDICELICRFNDMQMLMNELADPASPFAQNLKRLKWIFFSVPFGGFEDKSANARIFSSMLDLNHTLEYIEFEASAVLFKRYKRYFDRHHLVSLPVAAQPFPIQCRLSFLSIFGSVSATKRAKVSALSASALADLTLDRHVLSLIFSFAAECVHRRIYFLT